MAQALALAGRQAILGQRLDCGHVGEPRLAVAGRGKAAVPAVQMPLGPPLEQRAGGGDGVHRERSVIEAREVIAGRQALAVQAKFLGRMRCWPGDAEIALEQPEQAAGANRDGTDGGVAPARVQAIAMDPKTYMHGRSSYARESLI